MKMTEIHKELLELAKSLGISVRKEKGNFRSGFCTVNDKEIIVLNKTSTLESLTSVLALCLAKHTDSLYLKPVIREYIEKEKENKSIKDLFNIAIDKQDGS